MGLLGKIGTVVRHATKRFGIEIAMDLGTANTLVYVKGVGIVVNEPSLVALDSRTNRVVAIGRDAQEFVGRAPASVLLTRPLKDGVIADFVASMTMIKGFLQKAFVPRLWINSRLVIAIPSGTTQVERRAVREAAYEAGAGSVHLIEEPMAAALGAGLDVGNPAGLMIVDIGGGTTEVAIISSSAIMYCESIRVAGDEMDEAILAYLSRNMRLEIAPSAAEAIKVRIGCAVPPEQEERMVVTGKQIGGGGLRTVEVSSSQMSEALEAPVDVILDTIGRAIENTPPTLLADIQEQGMVLTGGGALLHGLDSLIRRISGIRAQRADDPFTAVVLGCGMALEDHGRWPGILTS